MSSSRVLHAGISVLPAAWAGVDTHTCLLIYPWRILIYVTCVTPEGLVSWGSRWGNGVIHPSQDRPLELCSALLWRGFQHKDTTASRSTTRSILSPFPKSLHITFALPPCYLLKFQVWLLLSTYWDGCILGEGRVIPGLPRYNAL